MSGVSQEWMFTVNKKIAELTKTVFRLHAETVDRKDEVNELKARYEDELSAAVAASQKSIDQAQNEVQNYRQNIDALVRRAYETEFSKVRKQYDDVRSRLEAQSKRIIEGANEQLASLKSQIEALKKKADAQMALFQNAQQELTKIKQDKRMKI